MARETKIERFEVSFMNGMEWRAKIDLFSKVRIGEDSKTHENFRAFLNLPNENYNSATPEEIKKEALVKFREAFIEITEWLKEQIVS